VTHPLVVVVEVSIIQELWMLYRFLGQNIISSFAFLVVERGQDQRCWPVIELDPVIFPVIKLVMNDLPASF